MEKETLKTAERLMCKDKFKEAALPLIKYLCENHHPHVTIIVTSTGAELLEGIKATGEVVDYLKD